MCLLLDLIPPSPQGCKRPGKMCSYQAEQHLVGFKKVHLGISVTIFCLPQNIAIWVDCIVENYKDYKANWRADFDLLFVSLAETSIQEHLDCIEPTTQHTCSLPVAINSNTTSTCSLMGQRGTALMDGTQLSTSSFLLSCSNLPLIFVHV
jgi:hypothetical protein